jgi:hypothetical protein
MTALSELAALVSGMVIALTLALAIMATLALVFWVWPV